MKIINLAGRILTLFLAMFTVISVSQAQTPGGSAFLGNLDSLLVFENSNRELPIPKVAINDHNLQSPKLKSIPLSGMPEFNNKARLTDTTNSFIKSASKGTTSLLRLSAGYSNDSLSFDPFVIYYDDQATYNFDGQLDALKLFNTDKNVANFYVFGNDNRQLSINAIPFPVVDICTLRLGLKTAKNGEVMFKIRDNNNLFLEKTLTITDNVSGISQVLTQGNQYKVNLIAGDYQDRFFLNISNIVTALPEITPNKEQFSVYSTHGILKADIIIPSAGTGNITLCSMTGQILLNKKIISSGYYEFNPSVRDGIYIVCFTFNNIRISKKLYIQSE